MSIPKISVVVCTYNRAEMLAEALASLMHLQTDAKFTYEIVVIDNASKDTTPDVVEELRIRCATTIRYCYEGKKGIAAARNRGLREASGEWIAFFDDDQLADPRWLLELYTYANDHDLCGAGGAVLLKLTEDSSRDLHPFVRMLLGEAIWSDKPFAYTPKCSPGTGNLMLHRKVFDQIGSFNEAYAVRSEDTELFDRVHAAGMDVWYVPTAIIHHVTKPERLTLKYLHRLSDMMGDGLAIRERQVRSMWQFSLRWLAKMARDYFVYRPRRLLATFRNQHELALGLDCQIVLSRAYTRRGGQIMLETVSEANRNVAWVPKGNAKPA